MLLIGQTAGRGEGGRGGAVDVDVAFGYESDSRRPAHIEVTYETATETKSMTIVNTPRDEDDR